MSAGDSEPTGARRTTLRMYILVLDDVPLGKAVVAAAHASLAAYLKFRDSPEVAEWLAGPFAKVVCRVSREQFEQARQVEGHVVVTEASLGDREVALAFRPRERWPKMFEYLSLFK